MREKILTYIERNSRVDLKDLAIMLGTDEAAVANEIADMEKEGVEFEKLERLTLGTLRKAVVDGDVKQGTVMAGQIAGLVSKEQTCEEIIKELMKEVSEVYKSHNNLA